MEILFITGTLLFLALILLVHVCIFQWLVNRNLMDRFSFGRAFIFLLVWWLVTVVVAVPANLLLNHSIPYLVNTVVGFTAFYLLLYKFSRASFSQSLKVFVIFSLIATVMSLAVVGMVRGFLFSPFVVSGVAMNPTFETGDYLIIKIFGSDYSRGDIVVHKYEEGQYFIKRIVGLPGEEIKIENGSVFIDGAMLEEPYAQGDISWEDGDLTLGSDEYFLMGDNREHSRDSRFIGPVSEDKIFGEYLTKIGLLSSSGWVE